MNSQNINFYSIILIILKLDKIKRNINDVDKFYSYNFEKSIFREYLSFNYYIFYIHMIKV